MHKKAAQVDAYIELLLRYNATHNLLRRKTKQEIIDNDIKDVLPFYNEFRGAKTVLDYGSGAGIPGILLAIEHPNINFVIAESTQKKAIFLKKAALNVGLVNTKILHARISKDTALKPFDIITNRAVSPAKTTIKTSKHLLKRSGFFLLFKGTNKTINQELIDINRRYSIIKNNLIINKERNLLKIYND